MDIDLNLLDIKSGDPAIYEKVTRQPLQPTLDYARRLSALGRPMWVRFVLVPGLTDGYDNVEKVADICAGLKSRRARGDPALPPDGQRQVAQARPRIPAGKRRAAGRRADRARARPVPQPRADRLLDHERDEEGRHGIRQDAARAAAADGAVPHDRDRLSRRRDQHQGLLARRGGGAVRRARHGLVRAEVGAGADGRDARPRALPLCRGHPVRQAVLPRPDERRRAARPT